MPTLVRLGACKITMYAADHLPPHFHIIDHDGREALVELESLTILRGSVSRAAKRQALVWATLSRSALVSYWQEFNP